LFFILLHVFVGTLHISDVSGFISSVSMSKDPKEIAKMVMAWSNRENLKAKDSRTKSSKLPVKKGSSLKFRDSNLLSGDMTLSELTEQQKVPVKPGSKKIVQDVHVVEKSLTEMKDSKSSTFSYENKTNADGEESDKEDINFGRGVVTPLKSSIDNTIIDGYSPRLSVSRLRKSPDELRSSDGMNESLDRFVGQQLRKDDEFIQPDGIYPSKGQIKTSSGQTHTNVISHTDGIIERSPRGSTSGWAGHHIPDGTEYSRSSELHHGLSRQELDGTEDIQLVDSRGFDAISNKYPDQEHRYSNSHAPQKRYSDFDPKKHHAMLKAQAKKHPYSKSAENMTSTPVKNNVYVDDRPIDQSSLANTLPTHQSSIFSSNQISGHTRSLPESYSNVKHADQPFSQTLPEKVYVEKRKNEDIPSLTNTQTSDIKDHHKNTSEFFTFDVAQNCKLPSPQHSSDHRSQNIAFDEALMPPPPVPSFRHNLLPRERSQQPEKPTLLTSDAMMSKDFAREYLTREDPGRLVNRNVHPKPTEHPIDTDAMLRHRESDIPLPTHHDWPGDDMNISNRPPVYHSTPYNNNRVDTTIITPSSMHTMMSTGMMTELHADNLTMMEDGKYLLLKCQG
jgi:hypothetical protein